MTARSERQEPVYVISVAAKLLDVHPQTLRLYERLGLVAPARSESNIRLYSRHDVERVRRIQHLTQDMGVNLAGVEVILDLLEKMEQEREAMQRRIMRMRREVEARIARMREDIEGEVRRDLASDGESSSTRPARARKEATKG
ncbi:MAG: helix-turn-helix transcriptional regulator [Armatimonadota bacterium]|nr:MAG: helix-turn-helix transcriptional regulator [Armatimonadota bacterium]